MKCKVLVFSIIVCFSIAKVSAQITLKTEYIGESSFWLENKDDHRERIGNTRGSAMIYQGSANFPFVIKQSKYDKPIIAGIGMQGKYVSLNNKNFTEDIVLSQIMNIELGAYYIRPISPKWSVMASLGVGVYSPYRNLSHIRAKQILGSGSALFICQIRSNFELGAGIAINSTFGYPMVFPALYLNWDSQSKIDVKIALANGVEVSAGLKINRFLDIALIGEMNGQMALVDKEGKDMIFSHQYIVAGLRPSFKIGKKLSIPFTLGVNAMRPANYTERTLKAMFKIKNEYYFQVSSYAALGICINL